MMKPACVQSGAVASLDFVPRVFGPARPLPDDVRVCPHGDDVPELCAWCGVDRVGSCGACSDLSAVER